jgi:AraC-binding-like domain
VDLPICGSARFRTGRLECVEGTPRRAAVFMPGESAAIDWSGGCGQFCLMFPRALLQRELEAMLDRPLVKPLVFVEAMDVGTHTGRSWLDVLRLVERQARYAHGLLDHPLAAAHVAQALTAGLLLAQPHDYTEALAGPRRPAAPPAVRQAVELIHAHPEHPWTTAGLARRAAVSARSLQEGFARSYGVPPSVYLRSVRLDRPGRRPVGLPVPEPVRCRLPREVRREPVGDPAQRVGRNGGRSARIAPRSAVCASTSPAPLPLHGCPQLRTGRHPERGSCPAARGGGHVAG